jgi:hypothetical protein
LTFFLKTDEAMNYRTGFITALLLLLASTVAFGCAAFATGEVTPGSMLYSLANSSHAIRAISRSDGQLAWIAELESQPLAMALEDNKLWVTLENDRVVSIDTETGIIRRTVQVGPTEITFGSDSTDRHEIERNLAHIAAGGSGVWITDDEDGTGIYSPVVWWFGGVSKTSVGFAAVSAGEVNSFYDGIIADEEAAWVLLGNTFGVVKIAGDPLGVSETIELGENPRDPSGPRGSFYGFGSFVKIGRLIWVWDKKNNKLLKLDINPLSVYTVIDLNPIIGDDDEGYMADNGRLLFISSPENESILVFDGLNGDYIEEILINEATGHFRADRDYLYINLSESAAGELAVVDLASGDVVHKWFGVYADEMIID